MTTDKELRLPHSLADTAAILEIDKFSKTKSKIPKAFGPKFRGFFFADIEKYSEEAMKQIYLSPPNDVLKGLVGSFGEIYNKIPVQNFSDFNDINKKFDELNNCRDKISDLLENRNDEENNYQVQLNDIKFFLEANCPDIFVIDNSE